MKTTPCLTCNGEGHVPADEDCVETCTECWGKGSFTCIDGPAGCAGDVEYRYPGYGSRSFPRCGRHGRGYDKPRVWVTTEAIAVEDAASAAE